MADCPKKCHGCQKHGFCQIRVHEWVRSIELILSKHRPPGEGSHMAEQVIEYMAAWNPGEEEIQNG